MYGKSKMEIAVFMCYFNFSNFKFRVQQNFLETCSKDKQNDVTIVKYRQP